MVKNKNFMANTLVYYPVFGREAQVEFKVVGDRKVYPQFHLKLTKSELKKRINNLNQHRKYYESKMFNEIYNNIFQISNEYNNCDYVEIFAF